MKFLDSNGLTHFWSKVKTFISNNYLSLKGGTINGNINISGNVSALQFKKTNGTSTQVLIADGSVKGINSANGVAGLDSKGNVPLAQLGNLDTTVAEVVTALPTTNIKKHIYLIKDASGVTQNQYEEYIYTGDTSATYDASKWEKLGDFRATVDLADYAKKSETVDLSTIRVEENVLTTSPQGQVLKQVILFSNFNDENTKEVVFKDATSNMAGFMSIYDKNKLDGIANNANNYSLPTASSTIKGGITLGYSQSGKNYPVAIDSNGKAYVNVPWTDTNTTYSLATSTKDGLMKASDKAKLDGIPSNITADLANYAKKTDLANYATMDSALGGIGFNTLSDSIIVKMITADGNESDGPVLYPVSKTEAGIMIPLDKTKLDGIASGATADSAITTAEIDKLFT